MKILVTGIAGFIGFHIAKKLVDTGHNVIGIDNLNTYYSVALKYDRLKELGVILNEALKSDNPVKSKIYGDKLQFIKIDVSNRNAMEQLFQIHHFDTVCHLAAQAGVRYSLENPHAYVQSNIVGFMNLLENCRQKDISHLIYASSSSVYGQSDTVPFSTKAVTDKPISIYAATKKSNELMAHTYSHLYDLQTTGLRFFTVYGPWGRPDMAIYKFTNAIAQEFPIQVYNYGKSERDFTYIDDIVEGIYRIILKKARKKPFKIYNIGRNKAERLTDFILQIEKNLNKTAKKEMLPQQPGDVDRTWANVDSLIEDYNYSPQTDIKTGIAKFIEWYKDYNGL